MHAVNADESRCIACPEECAVVYLLRSDKLVKLNSDSAIPTTPALPDILCRRISYHDCIGSLVRLTTAAKGAAYNVSIALRKAHLDTLHASVEIVAYDVVCALESNN